jgi:hypothetical protein
MIAALMLVLQITQATPDNNPFRDGNWWVVAKYTDAQGRTTEEGLMKLSYVRGFLDSVTPSVVQFSGVMSVKPDVTTGECFKNTTLSALKYTKGVDLRQVMDGLDKFYSDFTTRRIPIPNAIFIVLRQIAGDDKDVIQKEIDFYRKNSGDAPQR